MWIGICCLLFCITLLTAQHKHLQHKHNMEACSLRVIDLARRIAALEQLSKQSFDPIAFDDLKSKVEALRITQGLRR